MADFPIPTTWDRPGLEAVGFEGFLPFETLTAVSLPESPGIYVVLRPANTEPTLLPVNPAKRQKGKDPTYLIEKLQAKWVPGCTVVYIGKANPKKGLHGRVTQYRRMAANHWGGRAIWQLADSAELLLAWIETPEHDPEIVETRYIDAFEGRYERIPFANWRRGSIPGAPVAAHN